MSNYLSLPITIHAYGRSRAWQFLYSFLQAISITSTLLRVKEVSLGHVSCKTSHLFQLCVMSFKKDLAIFAYKGELCIIFYLTLCAIYSIVIFPTSVPSNLNHLLSWSINDRKASHVKCLIMSSSENLISWSIQSSGYSWYLLVIKSTQTSE